MNTFTKRDHVFAKLNLKLQGGSFTLLHKKKKMMHTEETAFMQLEFSGIKSVSLLSQRPELCPLLALPLIFNSLDNCTETKFKFKR